MYKYINSYVYIAVLFTLVYIYMYYLCTHIGKNLYIDCYTIDYM